MPEEEKEDPYLPAWVEHLIEDAEDRGYWKGRSEALRFAKAEALRILEERMSNG